MIKQTVTYKDFNDEDQTEDLYFHLSKSELIELELGMEGGLGAYLQKMVQSQQPSKILAAFKKIISAAYGERSLDGKRFVKDEAITRAFLASPAYDAMFMRLVTSEEAVTEFILGVVPKDLIEEAGGPDKLLSGAAVNTITLPETSFVVTRDKDIRPLTEEQLSGKTPIPPAFQRPPAAIVLPEELRGLTREQLLEAYDKQMGKNPSPPAA
jgi:hypothetical protein